MKRTYNQIFRSMIGMMGYDIREAKEGYVLKNELDGEESKAFNTGFGAIIAIPEEDLTDYLLTRSDGSTYVDCEEALKSDDVDGRKKEYLDLIVNHHDDIELDLVYESLHYRRKKNPTMSIYEACEEIISDIYHGNSESLDELKEDLINYVPEDDLIRFTREKAICRTLEGIDEQEILDEYGEAGQVLVDAYAKIKKGGE